MKEWDDEALKQLYNSLIERYERLKVEFTFILEREMRSSGIPYHLIMGRIKTFESFLDKAQRKRITDPIREIDDICGLRIICLFLSDLQRIRELITTKLEVVSFEDKIQETPMQSFGYMGLHVICKLPPHFAGPRYDDIKDLKAEIQVRTISMDAWASISHYLDYKSVTAVPSELRKDFYALSGLFYMADSHFEMFFQQQQKSRQAVTIEAETVEGLVDSEINLDTLMTFLRKRYPNREHAEASAVSELVDGLVESGYSRIGEVERDVARTELAFDSLESDEITEHAADGFGDDEVIRISLCILRGPFAKREEKYGRGFWVASASHYRYLVK